jgi:hypothetical protein
MTLSTRSIACLFLSAATASVALAQQATTRPQSLLEQLDRDTRALYAQIQGSVVRVALPPPMWVNELAAKESPLEKWKGQLDPAMRQKLEEHVRATRAGEYHQVNATVTTTTQPTTAPTSSATAPRQGASAAEPAPGGSVTVLAPVRVGANVQWRPVTITFSNHIGVVVDTHGRVLVPLYVEREAVGQRKLPVTLADGRTVPARFVGSDRLLNLTVLQMDQPLGHAVCVADGRPADGALVLMISPNAPGAHLQVWTGGHQDMGLVARMDGGIWGFARFGHFLKLDDALPVVDQLVRFGEIKRAQLGVWVQEVPPQDALRQHVPLLGGRPALKVLEVVPGSAAQRAGLKVDDLVLSLAGQPVGDTTDFAMAISHTSGPTDLRIIRDNAETTIRVELTPQ